MSDEPEEETLNEWVVSELSRTMDALRDLAQRHEQIVNHLADVCRRNDRMEQAGGYLAAMLNTVPLPNDEFIEEAIQRWRESNV